MNIFLVEDNFIQREFIKKTINKIIVAVNISAELHVFASATEFLKKNDLTLLEQNTVFFFDIDLNTAKTGIDLAESVRQALPFCSIYFITSYPNKAIEIINRNILAAGYVVKDLENFAALEEQMAQIFQKLIEKKNNDPNYLEIKNGHVFNFININDIIFIESLPYQKGYVQLHTKKDDFIFRSTINQLKAKIVAPFMMLDLKSYILNINHIKSIERKLGIITFDTDEEIYVSKRIIDKLVKRLK